MGVDDDGVRPGRGERPLSGIVAVRPSANAATRRPDVHEQAPEAAEPRPSIASMRRAYEAALRLFPDATRARETPGYRLFWTRDGKRIDSYHLAAEVGRYAVIGRHTACDVALDGDPDVSLRQLLAVAERLDDGSPSLRLLVLRAPLPFFLDDDEPRQNIAASGPVVVRVGHWIVGGLPTGDRGDPAPPSLPPHSVAPATVPPRRSQRSAGLATHITALPPASDIATHPRSGSAAPAGVARITVRHRADVATVDVADEDLDRGVLVGRAESCVDDGIRAVLPSWISRAHLLLLRQGGATLAFDLCSMNGTYCDGRKVRRVILPDDGIELELGNVRGIRLEWHPRAAGPG